LIPGRKLVPAASLTVYTLHSIILIIMANTPLTPLRLSTDDLRIVRANMKRFGLTSMADEARLTSRIACTWNLESAMTFNGMYEAANLDAVKIRFDGKQAVPVKVKRAKRNRNI